MVQKVCKGGIVCMVLKSILNFKFKLLGRRLSIFIQRESPLLLMEFLLKNFCILNWFLPSFDFWRLCRAIDHIMNIFESFFVLTTLLYFSYCIVFVLEVSLSDVQNIFAFNLLEIHQIWVTVWRFFSVVYHFPSTLNLVM